MFTEQNLTQMHTQHADSTLVQPKCPAYLNGWQAEADIGPQQHLSQDGVMPDAQLLQFDQCRQPFNLHTHM